MVAEIEKKLKKTSLKPPPDVNRHAWAEQIRRSCRINVKPAIVLPTRLSTAEEWDAPPSEDKKPAPVNASVASKPPPDPDCMDKDSDWGD